MDFVFKDFRINVKLKNLIYLNFKLSLISRIQNTNSFEVYLPKTLKKCSSSSSIFAVTSECVFRHTLTSVTKYINI